MMVPKKVKQIEVILWSIAFPGFGQLLNKKYIKGLIFIVLEILINIGGKVNNVIISSFLLETDKAVYQANYLWLLFYPCIYLFAIWDAYNDTGGGNYPFMYIPFVCSAYFGTLGVIYSSKFAIGGFLLGPIFLSILTMIIGFITGMVIRRFINHKWHLAE